MPTHSIRHLIRRSFVALGLLGLTACSSLKPRPELPFESAVPAGTSAAIDIATAAEEARHPNRSAFRLLIEGTEAFVIRAHSARMAERSIDIQTYIWHADLTGRFLTLMLLQAADRNVKVRLLVDDLDARGNNASFAALAAHPNISVRLFNPFSSRTGMLRFVSEGLGNFDRLNRRMHNKTWIVDNRIAIAGGRNIGNEYFSASQEVNFFDLDFAMVGPVVRDASASFDQYWNSLSAYPIEALDPKSVSATALEKLRSQLDRAAQDAEKSRYAQALAGDDAVKQLIEQKMPMEWSANYRFIADDPRKVGMQTYDASRTNVGASLAPVVAAIRETATIISPYFVPGDAGTQSLTQATASGKQVRVLTNSLVANDVAAVHGGYSQYRKALLQGGVQLWELKPRAANEQSSMFGSSGASLHTKALSVDSRHLFVGSYNLDPRSTWLNCEQGVLVENDILAKQFESLFATQTSALHAWRVTVLNDELSWSDGNETFDTDPKASLGRRFQAWLARALNLEAQL